MDSAKDFINRHKWLVTILSIVFIGLPQYIDSLWDLAEKILGRNIAMPNIMWGYWITVPLGVVMFGIAIWAIRSKKTITDNIGEKTIPSRRAALELAQVAWGLWHTGTRMKIEKLLKMESLKRILILEPDVDKASIGIIAERSGEGKESIVNQIQDTTKEAIENGKNIRWYSQHRESAFTIYDSNPVEVGGILKPCSDDAWMYVEYLNPKVGVDQRKGEVIYNKGKDKSRFIGFYQEYEDIWDNKSIAAADISKSQPKLSTTEEEKPAVIRNMKVKLDAKNTDKATGMEVTTPTELNNIDVNVTAENVKEATGFKSIQTNKPNALFAATIMCSCGKPFTYTSAGYQPSVIKCPHCGKEHKIH